MRFYLFLLSCFILFINNLISSTIIRTLTFHCEIYQKLFKYDYDSVKNTTWEPDMNKINIYLYNGTQTEIFPLTNASSLLLESPLFDIGSPIVMYIHGFLNTVNSEDVSGIVEAFKERGGLNVMALDTSDYYRFNYVTAIANVRFVGEGLADLFLQDIIAGGVEPSNIHLIGHSLGGHVSGFAGKSLTRVTGLKLGRISGLDVAGPCFYEVANDRRLYKTDADFVDVIHSDAGDFGIYHSIGHVDFFPNGGIVQPKSSFQLLNSHGEAWKFYKTSITTPEGFLAVGCVNFWNFLKNTCGDNNTYSYMGYGASPSAQYGDYFLLTSPKYPYYLGDRGIVPNNLIKAFFGFL